MGHVELLVMFGMIAFNSVFAAYEIALAAVSQARLKVLAGEKARGAEAALYMKENVEASLSAIQLGITLFGAVAAATGGAGAEEQVAPWIEARLGLSSGTSEFLALAAVVLPLTAVTIVFGELVPKVYALRNKERVCLRMSPAMKWFTFSVWPAVWLFETLVSAITDWGERRFRTADAGAEKSEAAELQELRAAAALARAGRLIGAREEGIISAAARLSTRPVAEIMIPAAQISMLDATARLADALTAAHLDMHTRYPVTDRAGDPQRIVGYANFKDIVAVMRLSPSDPSLRGITRPILSFAATDAIAHCLELLLRNNAHIALVRDATAVVGLLTLEDVIEELLGDIGDEYDKLPAHVVAAGPSWVVGGGAPLDAIKTATGLDFAPATDGATLADWLAARLGRAPQGGDVLVRDGVRVAVRKVRRNRLLEAQIARAEPFTPTGTQP